jgi:hypothetical protein
MIIENGGVIKQRRGTRKTKQRKEMIGFHLN